MEEIEPVVTDKHAFECWKTSILIAILVVSDYQKSDSSVKVIGFSIKSPLLFLKKSIESSIEKTKPVVPSLKFEIESGVKPNFVETFGETSDHQ